MNKPINIAINGFGRIGRVVLRSIFNRTIENINIVAINDLADAETLAHLLKYDSVHRGFNTPVSVDGDTLKVGNQIIRMCSEKEPKNLPWKELDVDIVIESTGMFRTKEAASQHITAGAKKVIISAPAQSKNVQTVVLGINDKGISTFDDVLSNASCTTNCAAPLVMILDQLCNIETAYITTIHSYTSDQRLHDSPHKDLRRARAAANSIIPTTTGAAKAITRIFPHLEGKMGGCGIRVPVPNGSLTDITFNVKHSDITVEKINKAFKEASESYLKGILEYNSDPIVSVDIIGNPHSCVFDPNLTSVIGNMVKVMGWYDNEAGYSNRLIDLTLRVGKSL